MSDVVDSPNTWAGHPFEPAIAALTEQLDAAITKRNRLRRTIAMLVEYQKAEQAKRAEYRPRSQRRRRSAKEKWRGGKLVLTPIDPDFNLSKWKDDK